MSSQDPKRALYKPLHEVRFLTAASLFDGHDAAINIMRRLLQAQGAEVIHLGHNRSVHEVVTAAIQEDVQGIALSSYQGGHLEYFKYLVDSLRKSGRADIKVYGGGGGVIVADEIAELEAYGVRKIFSPNDGQLLGLERMINLLIQECDVELATLEPPSVENVILGDVVSLARTITAIECRAIDETQRDTLREAAAQNPTPVIGITGTGGSGKSSLTDEIVRRFRLDQGDKFRIAILAVDPTKRRSGGALLGDRIRMNAVDSPQIFFRSLATRGSNSEIPPPIPAVIEACRAAGFDLIIVETPGIGQGDAAVVDVADLSLYVMTPEYGAASQLEKIDMLDLADVVAMNKFDRYGAQDALRAVVRQWKRSHPVVAGEVDVPVFGTIASRFNDNGTTALYQHLRSALSSLGLEFNASLLPLVSVTSSEVTPAIIPPARSRYLAEIAENIRHYHAATLDQSEALRRVNGVRGTRLLAGDEVQDSLIQLESSLEEAVSTSSRSLLTEFYDRREELSHDELTTERGTISLFRRSLSGSKIPRVALPRYSDEAELLRWLRSENLPGTFPFTAGVFAFKRDDEDPARMFAGEGDPFRTNRRFHLLSEGQPATRLSTAFDSVTLYGRDPDSPPDIYGKIGTSGVSIATLDDMKALYAGFDLCSPTTSVSMTINGPAPTILAMFLNTVVDQQLELFAERTGHSPTSDEVTRIRSESLRTLRGTVQADILKEDQGQNTCIFSTEFSLGVMADIQQYFVDHDIKNFYSVSISGYHIAEAGANPITQLAITLANGFTYVESYIARGIAVDDFAPNLSFFSPMAWTPSTRLSVALRGGFGRSPCVSATEPSSVPRSSSTTCRHLAGRCTPKRWRLTTSARPSRHCVRSMTTPTASTPTPTTRPSRRRPRTQCVAPSPSNSSSTRSGDSP